MPPERTNNRIQIVKYAPPPPELPVYGQVRPEDVSFFARTNYVAALETKNFIFGMKRVDRRRHVYMIGKSRVGKSKLLELLARQDIAYGHGLIFIDPHGDTIRDLLEFIPRERAGDVCVIDPLDTEHPPAFNPFDGVPDAFKHLLSEGLIEVMHRQFGAAWTPRVEHIFRFVCLALLDRPHATMQGIVSMLTDEAYRRDTIPHIKDETVRRFWEIQFPAFMEKYDAEAIMPLVNKFTQFFSDPILGAIVSQRENKVDLSRLINEKKIVLVNLARGRLDEDAAGFLGSLFIIKLHQAGIERTMSPAPEPNDFYVYCDEFPKLAVDTLRDILSLGKKYGFCLALAHQYIGQLSPKMQAAVLGYAGTIVVFRVGGDDAVKLKSEMAPVFDVKDMINLGTGQFYIKMMIDGEVYDPFSAETLKVLPAKHPSFREEIIRLSHEQFGATPENRKVEIAEM